MTTEQRTNLETLANYLLGNNLKAAFDMNEFSAVESVYPGGEGANDCGTVGCAQGHGPYAGIPKIKDETWWEYGDRVFGVHYRKAAYKEWEWMFAGEWKAVDNTAEGAAKRIKYLLLNGLPEDVVVSTMMTDNEEDLQDFKDWYNKNVLSLN